MASGQTEYYQFPLWEADDPVQRSEFNELNSKIDMLFCAVPSVEIAKTQAAEETLQISMDVSQVDLTKFCALWLAYSLPRVTYFSIRTNGIRDSTYHINEEFGNFDLTDYSTSVLMNVTCRQGNLLLFYPPCDGSAVALTKLTAYCDQWYFRTNIYAGIAPVTWDELQTLNFETSGTPFSAGSSFHLVGLKL